jgi:hypothetical protein
LLSFVFLWRAQKHQRVLSINGYKDVKPNDEEALVCAVSSRPVSVAINAGTKDFQLYADVSALSCSNSTSFQWAHFADALNSLLENPTTSRAQSP